MFLAREIKLANIMQKNYASTLLMVKSKICYIHFFYYYYWWLNTLNS